GILDAKIDTRNCLIVSDDRHPHDLLNQGHLDHCLRVATRAGLDPLSALQMVTINPSKHLGLNHDIGAIGPGKIADITIFDDLESFQVKNVIFQGEEIVREGKLIKNLPIFSYPSWTLDTVNLKAIPQISQLRVPWKASEGSAIVRVIGIHEHSLFTDSLTAELQIKEGYVVPNVSKDILPVVVLERHNKTGNICSAFVKGFGLSQGALASSVAHDSHNIIAVGSNYDVIQESISRLVDNRGGLVALVDDLFFEIPLPFAGIVTTKKLEDISQNLTEMEIFIKMMGIKLKSPFMALSFLALPVIPHLKITDKGLVDVDSFQLTPIVIDVQ
ncbi:MAG: adenine deaminase C-terminal domain-containing protein, partial [Promethearchaeota archaeon]